MRAALTVEYDRPTEIVDNIEPAHLGPHQVRVRVAFCGVCHSDIHMGGRLTPLPLIAGHEAAGEIEAIGSGITGHAVGDKVVITPMPSCGKCARCISRHPSVCIQNKGWMTGRYADGRAPFTRKGEDVFRGNGVGAFTELVVVSADAAVRIDNDVPLDLACLIGCAVQTGVGAVLNTAAVHPGASVLVMGLGAVGLSIVQGARIAGASQIIASDPVPARRDMAAAMGATDLIDPAADDGAKAARRLSGGGVDFAFEAAGSPALIAAGVIATVPGGAVVLVGAHDGSARLDAISAGQLVVQEKRLLGCMHGSSYSARDIPKLVRFWRSGQLDLETMVTARTGLDGVNRGLDDIRAGHGVRTVVSIGS